MDRLHDWGEGTREEPVGSLVHSEPSTRDCLRGWRAREVRTRRAPGLMTDQERNKRGQGHRSKANSHKLERQHLSRVRRGTSRDRWAAEDLGLGSNWRYQEPGAQKPDLGQLISRSQPGLQKRLAEKYERVGKQTSGRARMLTYKALLI